MENTSDYLMLGLLLICMKYDKKVCYKVLDNNVCMIDENRHENHLVIFTSEENMKRAGFESGE